MKQSSGFIVLFSLALVNTPICSVNDGTPTVLLSLVSCILLDHSVTKWMFQYKYSLLSCLVVHRLLQEHGGVTSGGIVGAAAQGNSLPSGRVREGSSVMSEEMGESEDCSQLIMSGGEELREMAPSSFDRMEVDNEEEVFNGADRSANSSSIAEDETEFEKPLLGRVSVSSVQVLPLEEEEAVPNPLLVRVVTIITTSPPLSPINKNCSFENPLIGRSSSVSSSSPPV